MRDAIAGVLMKLMRSGNNRGNAYWHRCFPDSGTSAQWSLARSNSSDPSMFLGMVVILTAVAALTG
jgi:hypothetical protein